jgi:hypothetical protein
MFATESSIEFFAEQLADQIKANNDQNVILFGHSRGGLIACEFAENLAAKHHITVQGVIAACTPFGGTDTAIFPFTLFSKSIDQMKTDSPYLRKLKNKINTDNENRFKCYAVTDDFLFEKTSASIYAVEDTIEIDTCMHHTVIVDKRLVEGSESILGIRSVIAKWATNPLPTQSAESISALIPIENEFFYTREGYSPEEVTQLHNFQKNVLLHYSKQFTQNNDISYKTIHKSLLQILEKILKRYPPHHPIYKAGQAVLQEAKAKIPFDKHCIAAKKWNISLLLAIQTLNHPDNMMSLTYLKKDAEQHTLGHASSKKQLGGALALSASFALIGLIVAGIISSAMVLSIALTAALLGALGGYLIYQGTLSAFALRLSQLEQEARQYKSSSCHL